MQRTGTAAPIVATAGLLLETSLGTLTIDLLGADCPALSANFVNLCRAQFWDGAVVTEVIPEVAVFFSLTADPVYDHLLRTALGHRRSPATQSLVQSFWSLLPSPASAVVGADPTTASSSSSPSTPDVVGQQEAALQRAIQQEVRLCKRRRCVGLSLQPTTASGANGGAHQPVFTAAPPGASPSPCTVSQAGSLLIDTTAPTLRFGLTLSNRPMDFLDRQYVVIGHAHDSETVLRRLQRAPFRDRAAGTTPTAAAAVGTQEDVVAGRPAASWPQPVRIIRLKRVTVLPTAGTEKFLPDAPAMKSGLSVLGGADHTAQRQRQRVGQALHEAGCFAYWASAAAVRAAQEQLADVVAARLAVGGAWSPATRPRTVAAATTLLQGTSAGAAAAPSSPCSSALQPFIVLEGSPASSSRKLVYNAHFSGAFLSSEDEDDVYDTSKGGSGPTSLSAKQLEERRKIFMQQHQEKANETLSLMLNVLNGVADTRGDIKPPENVLFVCKLNPVTTGEGLAMCFAQFGRVVSAEVINDAKTKQSLCYGFVEFETVEACFRAFQKMDKALVDDCRIHVDFSQSVSKLWAQRQREMRKRDRPV